MQSKSLYKFGFTEDMAWLISPVPQKGLDDQQNQFTEWKDSRVDMASSDTTQIEKSRKASYSSSREPSWI